MAIAIKNIPTLTSDSARTFNSKADSKAKSSTRKNFSDQVKEKNKILLKAKLR